MTAIEQVVENAVEANASIAHTAEKSEVALLGAACPGGVPGVKKARLRLNDVLLSALAKTLQAHLYTAGSLVLTKGASGRPSAIQFICDAINQDPDEALVQARNGLEVKPDTLNGWVDHGKKIAEDAIAAALAHASKDPIDRGAGASMPVLNRCQEDWVDLITQYKAFLEGKGGKQLAPKPTLQIKPPTDATKKLQAALQESGEGAREDAPSVSHRRKHERISADDSSSIGSAASSKGNSPRRIPPFDDAPMLSQLGELLESMTRSELLRAQAVADQAAAKLIKIRRRGISDLTTQLERVSALRAKCDDADQRARYAAIISKLQNQLEAELGGGGGGGGGGGNGVGE